MFVFLPVQKLVTETTVKVWDFLRMGVSTTCADFLVQIIFSILDYVWKFSRKFPNLNFIIFIFKTTLLVMIFNKYICYQLLTWSEGYSTKKLPRVIKFHPKG